MGIGGAVLNQTMTREEHCSYNEVSHGGWVGVYAQRNDGRGRVRSKVSGNINVNGTVRPNSPKTTY